MEQSPSLEHLKQFVYETYGPNGVKITPVENPVYVQKEKNIEHEALNFVERPKFQGIKFPELPPLDEDMQDA